MIIKRVDFLKCTTKFINSKQNTLPLEFINVIFLQCNKVIIFFLFFSNFYKIIKYKYFSTFILI